MILTFYKEILMWELNFCFLKYVAQNGLIMEEMISSSVPMEYVYTTERTGQNILRYEPYVYVKCNNLYYSATGSIIIFIIKQKI